MKRFPTYIERREAAQAQAIAKDKANQEKKRLTRQMQAIACSMVPPEPKEDPWKIRVMKALCNYRLHGKDGWDILRFAKQGRIEIDAAAFGFLMSDWYPRNPDYIILRLAKMGKLSYKMTDEKKLAQLQ